MSSLRKKVGGKLEYDQIADAYLNFQQCSFISECHILLIFWLPILRLSFLLKFLDLYRF